MNILFSGYYGHENMGDDAFGLISIWGAQKFWHRTDTALLSNNGPFNKDIPVEFVLPKKQRFKGEFLLQAILKIIQSNIIILSGGSILSSRFKPISLNGIVFILSSLRISKIGAIGVSLGPFKSDDDYNYIQKKLKNFKFLVLRDKTSYEIAISMKLPYKPVLGADLAFLLPTIHTPKVKGSCDKKILGVSICHYERYVKGNIDNENRRENQFLETLIELLKVTNVKLRFFIINGNDSVGDKTITLDIITKLNLSSKDYELIPYSPDTLQMLEKLAECNAVFTTRLHGAIFSATMNIPSLLVQYHPKCTDYLNDIGVDKFWRIDDMNVSPSIIKDKLLTILNNEQEDFYPNIKHIQSLSKNNFTKVQI